MWLKWRFFPVTFLITVLCSFLLIVLAESIGEKNKKFHFEAGWVKHKDYKKIMKKVWRIKDGSADKWAVLRRKLDGCRKDLKCWAKTNDSKSTMDIQKLEDSLQEVQKEGDPGKLEVEMALKEELDNLLEVEDLKWRQRAKEDRLKFGDRNTKYFHACASQKNHRNLIQEIADLRGKKWTSQRDIEWAFIDYFQWLYRAESFTDVDCCTRAITPKVTPQMNQNLIAPVSIEEVQLALNQMASLKAPGPD
jgi:hypothetical protein